MKVSDYLFPRQLAVSSSGIKKILLIGSCLTEFYHKEFSARQNDVDFDFVLYNNADILPPKSDAEIAQFDLQYIQIPLRSVLTDAVVRIVERGHEVDWIALGRRNIDAMLEAAMAYNARSGLLTIISNFIVPQGLTAAALATQSSRNNLDNVVRELNIYISEKASEYKNTFVADVDMVANSLGKKHFLDDTVYFYTHGSVVFPEWSDHEMHAPWTFPEPGRMERLADLGCTYEIRSGEFVEAVYRQVEHIYRAVHQIDAVKLVIFDLDNTMWRGQLAEHYRPGMEWPYADGWPMGIWEAIQHLRRRGIVVSISSKNDEQEVVSRWNDATQLGFVKYSDFTFPQINWKPKAENIQNIIESLSLTPKSVVFVDDNPVERESVKAQMPDIRVIGADPFVTRRILLWSSETQIARVTDVTASRENMLKKQIVREEQRRQLSRGEFLAGLGATMNWWAIEGTGHSSFSRALELVNKTNQFNTNGVRWSMEDFERHFGRGGRVHAFSVEDKYTEYGTVGVVFSLENEILQFVMSCRVLGMEIEQAAVRRVVDDMRASGARDVTASVVATPSNTPCRDVFERAGFTALGGGRYGLKPEDEAVFPAHVRVVEGQDRPASGLAPLPADFDPDLYLSLHEDVRRSGLPADYHYVNFGFKEGRGYK